MWLQDTLCTAGLQTTAASRVLEGYTPSHDATSVARLKAAGGIIVGKCNCDAFAMGSTSESSAYKVSCCLSRPPLLQVLQMSWQVSWIAHHRR